MNLTLRDIGALVDTLKNARRLGLECGDATMLEIMPARRADAGWCLRHTCAGRNSGPSPARMLAAAGLRGVGYIADIGPN